MANLLPYWPTTAIMMSTSEHWISVKNGSTSSSMTILSRLSSRRLKHSKAFFFVCNCTCIKQNASLFVDHVADITIVHLSFRTDIKFFLLRVWYLDHSRAARWGSTRTAGNDNPGGNEWNMTSPPTEKKHSIDDKTVGGLLPLARHISTSYWIYKFGKCLWCNRNCFRFSKNEFLQRAFIPVTKTTKDNSSRKLTARWFK